MRFREFSLQQRAEVYDFFGGFRDDNEIVFR